MAIVLFKSLRKDDRVKQLGASRTTVVRGFARL